MVKNGQAMIYKTQMEVAILIAFQYQVSRDV
jgi:hypothetical protein